jgi:cysteine sulfinate desulfinase/cysteine desulfurase-like protein
MPKDDLVMESIADIAVSKSSACNSSSLQKSHVIQAINSDSTLSDRTIRVSFGLESDEYNVTELVSKLINSIQIINKGSTMEEW